MRRLAALIVVSVVCLFVLVAGWAQIDQTSPLAAEENLLNSALGGNAGSSQAGASVDAGSGEGVAPAPVIAEPQAAAGEGASVPAAVNAAEKPPMGGATSEAAAPAADLPQPGAVPSGLVAESPAEFPLETVPQEALDAQDENQVAVKAREIQAMRDLELGQKALSYGIYQTALGHFLSAEKNLPARLAAGQARQKANEGAMLCQYHLAMQKMQAGELEGENGALALAKLAYSRNRRFKAAERLQERIELRIAEQKVVADREGRIRSKAPDRIEQVQKTEKLIDAALQHMRVREYGSAEAKLKMVLAIDEYNVSAIELLKEVHEKQAKLRMAERAATSVESVKAVTATWNPRDYKYYDVAARVGGGQAQGEIRPPDEKSLTSKMEKIMIPDIAFREANIRDVMTFLAEISRSADPETDPAKKGINIVLNLPEESAAKTISFSAKYVSLLEAFKVVTEMANLKYRVEKNLVVVLPADAPQGDLITRFYAVDPTVVRSMMSAPSATPEDATGGSPFTSGALDGSPLPGGGGSDLRDAFIRLGVPFPRGSQISFISQISKIVHCNTEANLAVFERIFNEFNVVSPQVEIETRFVDIGQDDLKEMGFEWRLLDNWELLQKTGNNLPASARPRVVARANNSSGGFTKGLRFGSVETPPGTSGEAGSQLALQSVLTNPEMLMLMRLVEQSGHADLLSAPKITTQPGEEATVKVTTEYIYPTEYRVEAGGATALGGTVGGALVTTPIVVPESFETREVGVILTVRPDISPGGDVITLTLSPDVVTDPVWHDYGYALPDGSRIPMMMPFFHRRTATTTVRVYDGATVVLGGMITEDLKTADDKIPGLGDIPLLGVLFRSKQKNSQKRNLMIFVTAKLVDPASRPVRKPGAGGEQAPPAAVAVSTQATNP